MSRAALAALCVALLVPSCSSSSQPPAAGTPGGADAGPGVPGVDGGESPADGGGAAPPTCPTAGTPTTVATLDAKDLDEVSGLAASARHPGVYWMHNDSGDTARAFAVDSTGKLLTTLTFDTAATDIEDMAIEDESATRSLLYFGDFGDNAEARPSVTIHRVVEPAVTEAAVTAASETMTVVYPDGPHNAETLLFDPATRDLLIVTKVIGQPAAVHRIGPFAAGQTITTQQVATVDVGLATGGEISRDGRYIGIRNYGPNAFLWVREPGETLAAALARPPCTPPVASEAQGESLAFQIGNTGFVTISEGKKPDLHVTPLVP